MHIAYYDEAGDDGFPKYSSTIFVLSALYLHHLNWREIYENTVAFRRAIKEEFDFPIGIEMHCKEFLLNKNPYKKFELKDEARIEVVARYCQFIGSQNFKIINVSILKPKIRKQDYLILDTALKYSVQRIENDLDPRNNPDEKFLIITDEGRVGKMRKTTRRIQRVNFIPSKYSLGSYRQEVRSLIEDPLPKNSKESYFIQMADVVAFVVYLYSLKTKGIGDYSNRIRKVLDETSVHSWLEALKPSLNLSATADNGYGVVFHPK